MAHTLRIFHWQLETMDEYSSTLPTGTTFFKMWKRLVAERCDPIYPWRPAAGAKTWWVVGQYHPVEDPDRVGIRWFQVVYLEGPMPPAWRPPDWSNFERFKRDRQLRGSASS